MAVYDDVNPNGYILFTCLLVKVVLIKSSSHQK